ncbi:MAG: TIGR04255 family protein [Myxococcota bacterium]
MIRQHRMPLHPSCSYVRSLGVHAPITEAVVDLRVEHSSPPDLRALRNLADTISKGPVKPISEWTGNILLHPDSSEVLSSQSLVKGYICPIGADAVVQFRVNGLAFGQLASYTNWPALRDQAMNHWHSYKQLSSPTKVTRIGLRYVNRIVMSDWDGNMEGRFQLRPVVPPEAGVVRWAQTRLVTHHSTAPENQAIVTQSVVPPDQQIGHPSVILDIDAFQDQLSIPSDSRSVLQILEDLRVYKNDLFFSALEESFVESLTGAI